MNRDSPLMSPLVIGGAALVLVVGAFIGFRLLTASAETNAGGPTCTDRTITEGDTLTTALVKVDIYNASQRAGLANRVSINLQRRGFLAGEIGNSDSEVAPGRVAILTADQEDPRVRLVAAQFGDVEFAEPDIPVAQDSVTVIVGNDYEELSGDETREITTDRTITTCVPILPASDEGQ